MAAAVATETEATNVATFPRWDDRLLVAFDVKPTAARRKFLQAWAACEGGGARFNPLNTTLQLRGSRRYNAAGVQHYLDAEMGLAATILTLRLAYYRPIIVALRTPSLSARTIGERSASAIGIWGTNSACVERALS